MSRYQSRVMLELTRAWPYHLEIRRYSQRSAAGTLPKLGELMETCKKFNVEFGTWRKGGDTGHRIFGFKTRGDRVSFMAQIDVEFKTNSKDVPVA